MKKLISIELTKETDDCPDFSTIGEYTKNPYGAICCACGEFVEDGKHDNCFYSMRKLPYFKPYAAGLGPKDNDYKTYGKQDFWRAQAYNDGDWWFLWINLTAIISLNGTIQRIKTAGFFGIESDSGDYIKEIAQDQWIELKDILLEIGFSHDEIDKAEKVGF